MKKVVGHIATVVASGVGTIALVRLIGWAASVDCAGWGLFWAGCFGSSAAVLFILSLYLMEVG